MKKNVLIIFCFFTLCSINAQNYGNGNGAIISEETIDYYTIVRRKHVQTVKMSDSCDVPEDYKSLWEDYSMLYASDSLLDNEYGLYPLIKDCSGKIINIKEIVKITSDGFDYPYLLHVEVEGKTGYMRAFKDECALYDQGIWSIIGQIESSGRKWTIRKIKDGGWFEIKDRLYVRDKPGTKGTNKVYLFYKDEELPDENQSGKRIKLKSVTEEKEIIDGIEGRWLNIEYENIEGWVFEGYVYCGHFYGYFEPEALFDMVFTYGQP